MLGIKGPRCGSSVSTWHRWLAVPCQRNLEALHGGHSYAALCASDRQPAVPSTGACCGIPSSSSWHAPRSAPRFTHRPPAVWRVRCQGHLCRQAVQRRTLPPRQALTTVADCACNPKLGMQKQRQWLNDTIARGNAAVTLVASGSVLLGRPGATNSRNDTPPFSEICSGDDWDCYRPAQQNLLGMLARKTGCVIVITGDYHYADIKRMLPGEDAPYKDVYMPPVRRRLANALPVLPTMHAYHTDTCPASDNTS